MRHVFITLLLLLVCANIFGQKDDQMTLEITTDVLIKKKKEDAVKVPIRILIPDMIDTVVLYRFNKFVPSSGFTASYLHLSIEEKSSTGLNYIIKNLDNEIISGRIIFASYENFEDEHNAVNSLSFIDTTKKKLKIERKVITDFDERNKYNRARYELKNKSQHINLYPLLGDYHPNLPRGEYYLYFVYIFYPVYDTHIWIPDKPNENIFRWRIFSNKVKLIIE